MLIENLKISSQSDRIGIHIRWSLSYFFLLSLSLSPAPFCPPPLSLIFPAYHERKVIWKGLYLKYKKILIRNQIHQYLYYELREQLN